MNESLESRNQIEVCVNRPDVAVCAWAAEGAWWHCVMLDEERLALAVGSASLNWACTLNLRTGALEFSADAARAMAVQRSGEGFLRLTEVDVPRTILCDGDMLLLATALPDDMPARGDARETLSALANAAGGAFAALLVSLPGVYDVRRVPARIEEGEALADFVSEKLEAADCPPKFGIAFMTCLDELFSNIAYYSGSPEAEVACSVAGGYASVRLKDTGKPFDPRSIQPPDIRLSAEERGIGGLGVFMVKKMMDSFEYEYRDGQNITVIRKRIST